MNVLSMRTALVLQLLVLSSGAWAGNTDHAAVEATNPAPNPTVALERHFRVAQEAAWNTETVEIEASLPRLAEHGRLRAIRRLLPFGRPDFEVLATEGDRTVRQQVIARYLSAEVEAANLSPASVAITPVNYRFQYRASISDGRTLTYVYEITPRKRGAGLIIGQLWIDAASGMTVRQTGYLIRTPSIFVKRINLTRDTLFRDGVAYAKKTRVTIDTRLVGRADLTITEQPYTPETSQETVGETL